MFLLTTCVQTAAPCARKSRFMTKTAGDLRLLAFGGALSPQTLRDGKAKRVSADAAALHIFPFGVIWSCSVVGLSALYAARSCRFKPSLSQDQKCRNQDAGILECKYKHRAAVNTATRPTKQRKEKDQHSKCNTDGRGQFVFAFVLIDRAEKTILAARQEEHYSGTDTLKAERNTAGRPRHNACKAARTSTTVPS